MDISKIRTDYKKLEFLEHKAKKCPFEQFRIWLNESIKCEVFEPNAMFLATIKADNQPTGRIVLLKYFDENGFCFFTNYNSNKGEQLVVNPKASITFFWPQIERQVRIEGNISKVSDEISDKYFSERPRESQIGAWASPQSEIIGKRAILEENYREFDVKFGVNDIPRPSHWGGYCLQPLLFEFWQGRPSRLHDRLEYTLKNNQWVINRLAP